MAKIIFEARVPVEPFHLHTEADVSNTMYVLMVKPSDVPYVAQAVPSPYWSTSVP